MKVLILLFVLTAVSFALSQAEEAKAKDAAREYIKDHLKAPATAIFSKETVCARAETDFEEASGLAPTPECIPPPFEKVGDGKESVVYRGSVDSQNSYGALLRTKFQLYVFFSGKWTVIDLADSVRELHAGCIAQNRANRALGRREKIRDCDAEYPSARKAGPE